MNFTIKKMGTEHIEDVISIERSSFLLPWPKDLFIREINADYAQNFICTAEKGISEEVIGYIFAWTIGNECTINKIACHYNYRRRGAGSFLLKHLIEESFITGARIYYLEVRKYNEAALSFYRKYGFNQIAIRKGYYSDTKEDAVIMKLLVSEVQDLHVEKHELSISGRI
jgi:ribosomal-protein-alanine N-acetyltransferase